MEVTSQNHITIKFNNYEFKQKAIKSFGQVTFSNHRYETVLRTQTLPESWFIFRKNIVEVTEHLIK